MEEWRDVSGYEGLYQVSSLGNVRSKRGEIIGGLDTDGYRIFTACLNGTQKTLRVAKEVGLAFIPNPDNKPTIDHINRNRTDNRVENLRWCSYQEQNMNRHHQLSRSGERHIYLNKRGHYEITIKRGGKVVFKTCRATIESAKEARDAFLQSVS